MSDRIARQAAKILLVDDNPGDIRLATELFKEVAIPHEVNVVMDGGEVLEYLNRNGKYANASRPDLIIMDMTLPKKNAHEILSQLKTNPQFRCIPVIILTGSSSEEQIEKAYALYANCCINKSSELEGLSSIIHSIMNFWFEVAKLPASCT
jgi:two-component system, chemotaxis family, response regulator Rcp1